MYFKLWDDQKITINTIHFNDGNYGEQIKSNANNEYTFSETEFEVLSIIADNFCSKNTKEIVDISHNEPAWKENELDKKRIGYQKYAFDLIGV